MYLILGTYCDHKSKTKDKFFFLTHLNFLQIHYKPAKATEYKSIINDH